MAENYVFTPETRTKKNLLDVKNRQLAEKFMFTQKGHKTNLLSTD